MSYVDTERPVDVDSWKVAECWRRANGVEVVTWPRDLNGANIRDDDFCDCCEVLDFATSRRALLAGGLETSGLIMTVRYNTITTI